MVFYSPLRYPGGKGKISNYFKQIIQKNKLYDHIYVEPYAGGASVGLSLLFNEYVDKIVINDIDRSVYAFWYSVLYKTKEFCELIDNTPINVKTWELQNKIQKNKKNSELLKLGFSTFFLNRTNRSGILSAGCIGGKNQKGKWKINARYNKKDLINRIKKIALYKNRIKIYNLDAKKLIRKLNKEKNDYIFYFDPPYYCKGKELYINFYTEKDHQKIAKEIKSMINSKWVVTYDNVLFIKNLYCGFTQKVFDLQYSAGKQKKGKEVMIFSKDLSPVYSSII